MVPRGIVVPTPSAVPSTPSVPQQSSEGLATVNTNPDTLKSRHWENHRPYEAFTQQTVLQEMESAMWGIRPPGHGDEATHRKSRYPQTTQLQGFVTISVPTATIAQHRGIGGDDYEPQQQVTRVKQTTVWHTKTETQTRFLGCEHARHPHASWRDGCGDSAVESAMSVLDGSKIGQTNVNVLVHDADGEVNSADIWKINIDRRGIPATPITRGSEGEDLWGTAQTVTTSTPATPSLATQDFNAGLIANSKHEQDTTKVQTRSPLSAAAVVPGIPKHLTTLSSSLPPPSLTHQGASKMYTGRVSQEIDPLLLELLNPIASPTPTITQPPTLSPSLNRWNRVPSFEAEWADNATAPWEFGFDLPGVPAPLVWLLFLGLVLGLLGSAVVYLVNFPPAFLSRTPSRKGDDEHGRGRYQGFENGSLMTEPPPSAVSTVREFECGAAVQRRTRAARDVESGTDGASPSDHSHSKFRGESPTGRTPLLRSGSSSPRSAYTSSPSPPRSPPRNRPQKNYQEKRKQEILLSPLGTHFPAAETAAIPLVPLSLPPRDRTAQKMRAERRPQPLNLNLHPHTEPGGQQAIPRLRTSDEWIAARAAFASSPDMPHPQLHPLHTPISNESDIEAQTPSAQRTPLMKKNRSGFGLAAYLPSAMSLPASPAVRWSNGGAGAWLESIDGAVGRVVERVARFTADEGGEGGLVLPVTRG
ncbi:uncharacterized protein BDZ99DRAFT_493632 [Mytilinidion resinicola]|uniref:Uncharacterized protein n=1 Tax=Mytilinidion resinicola TaxID=574789 RepID=A0A6A6Z4G6_9PEZI|nr:uncharacterized protein BDZ99DRAFT_493632 [Mytilinidion resinicola]KAF2815629.1 hypothetical protein BDZ99DRAFT_493632 [Mytilinidion resinicola]